jgi:hypothetical protein
MKHLAFLERSGSGEIDLSALYQWSYDFRLPSSITAV